MEDYKPRGGVDTPKINKKRPQTISATHELLSFIGLNHLCVSHQCCSLAFLCPPNKLIQRCCVFNVCCTHQGNDPCAVWSWIYSVHHWAAVVQQQHCKKRTCFVTHAVIMRYAVVGHIASEFLCERVQLILIEIDSLGNDHSDLQHICSAHVKCWLLQ